MEKRLRRGGGRSPFSPSSVMDRSILLRRIKSQNLSNSFPDSDIVIQRLHEHYPDYALIKLQSFSARLREVLQKLRNSSTKPNTAGDTSSFFSSDGEKPSRKKRGKEDMLEERLLLAESKHLRRLQRILGTSCSTSDSSDDSTSTSDDASFEENIEPEFDVTKSMLRERYVKQSEQSVQKGNAEKNVEIEVVADEKRKIGIAMKKGGGSEKEIPVLGRGVVSGDHRSTVVTGETGREGPRFRDLGGMKMILDDLMMEVVVPLCHPELPRRLGVRPIVGILLHGPPGCGKTKLAHAIANETGVPFYKISTT